MEFNVVDYNPREKCFFWTKNNTKTEAHIYFASYKKALLFFIDYYEHEFIKLVENLSSLARSLDLVLHKRESLDNLECLNVEENYLKNLVEALAEVLGSNE